MSLAEGDRARAVICDVDGTLVDTNFHHAVAWWRAFARCGVTGVEAWRIHRSIGMGGDRLVASVAGDAVEDELGGDVREAEKEIYDEMLDEVRALPGAPELLRELTEAGAEVVLASSAPGDEVEHYVELLEAGDVVASWTSSSDVSDSKPAPDLVTSALEKVTRGPAVMLGDTNWDCEAAGRAGIVIAAVLSGGFGRDELIAAGAARVYESPQEVRSDIEGLLGLVTTRSGRG